MKLYLILLSLILIFSLSHCDRCVFGRGNTEMSVTCDLVGSKPVHVIKDKSVSCGPTETLTENINSISVRNCDFDEISLFENLTTLLLRRSHDMPITLRKETFVGMNNLEKFIVKNAKVNVLPSVFSDLPNIELVAFDNNNNLKLSESAFHGAYKLKLLYMSSLYLKSASISSLPDGFFRDLNNLEWLEINKCDLADLNAIDFTGLESVKWLGLSENDISIVTGNAFHIMTNLKYLTLKRNKISDVGSMLFSKLQNLVHLNLEYNRIEQLKTTTFSGLTNLRSINLRNNRIQRIEDGTFSNLNYLKKLDLSYNNLTALTEHSFNGLTNLRYLAVHHNLISSINVNAFTALTKLIQLDLSNQQGQLAVDLNAFPQFVDLTTKTVIYTPIPQPDDFEKRELQWLENLPIGDDTNKIYSDFFGNFTLKRHQDELDVNDLSQAIRYQWIILGNLNLANIEITSVNVEKRL
ncbi:leucine-rich repeat-containing protein 15-like [Bradysia coprophila]|uniref:leucine-rich repeat-containing protein 15-like n=1 Tax=Bradysia coprophila TaxID=38358 RepID=UPI00187D7FB8|nr:leucine-rich repeat-containing protein 15-like [Bradysia coprophila]